MEYFFQISNLLSTTYYASGAYVPSQGWALFGGYRPYSLPTSQILKAIDGEWEKGPFPYLNQTDTNQCVVQVSKYFLSCLENQAIFSLRIDYLFQMFPFSPSGDV